MQEGRRYRVDQVYVRDWKSFIEVQKNWDFIKTLKEQNADQCQQQIAKNLKELIEDQKKQCYVFPDSLKPLYIQIMKKLIQSDQFTNLLQYQHEALFLGKSKQLVVFKKRASVSLYLCKYRPTAQYQKHFKQILQVSQKYQALIVQRNILISKQVAEKQINQQTKKIDEFKKSKLEKALNNWRNYVIKMVKDFISQPKKQQMLFLGVNNLLTQQLRQICKNFELYISNRYQKISPFDQYRDISLTKFDKSQPSIESNDNSKQDDDEQVVLQNKFPEEQVEKQYVVQVPKDIENVFLKQFDEEGAKCIINILSFGKINPVEHILVRLKSPNQNEHQKKYEQKIIVTQRSYEYPVVLHCLASGCSIFQIVAVNNVGTCKNPYIFRLWMDGKKGTADINTGIMKLDLDNHPLYLLGESENGTVPNWSQTQEQSKQIRLTTQQKWQQCKFLCSDFSISSHGTICNRKGDVASWGKLYYFDQDGLNQEATNEDEDQEVQQAIGKLGAECYRIQAPSRILEDCFIRKVSCGQGYCLMADSLGRAWSFGMNIFGQLGLQHNEESIDTSEPAMIKYFAYQNVFVTQVIASQFGASFAIDNKGLGYRWGTNQVDQTNRPIKDSYQNIINFEYPDIVAAQNVPVPIGKKLIAQKIKSINPGFQFVFLITEEDRLYGWGKTKYLGKGLMQDAHFKAIQNVCNPIYVMEKVNRISVGKDHVLALRTDGQLLGWGESKYFLENATEFLGKPKVVLPKFEGEFVCASDFSVFQQKGNLRVVGNKNVFKKGVYNLPCKAMKLAAGQGIIMVMGEGEGEGQSKRQVVQKAQQQIQWKQ